MHQWHVVIREMENIVLGAVLAATAMTVLIPCPANFYPSMGNVQLSVIAGCHAGLKVIATWRVGVALDLAGSSAFPRIF